MKLLVLNLILVLHLLTIVRRPANDGNQLFTEQRVVISALILEVCTCHHDAFFLHLQLLLLQLLLLQRGRIQYRVRLERTHLLQLYATKTDKQVVVRRTARARHSQRHAAATDARDRRLRFDSDECTRVRIRRIVNVEVGVHIRTTRRRIRSTRSTPVERALSFQRLRSPILFHLQLLSHAISASSSYLLHRQLEVVPHEISLIQHRAAGKALFHPLHRHRGLVPFVQLQVSLLLQNFLTSFLPRARRRRAR